MKEIMGGLWLGVLVAGALGLWVGAGVLGGLGAVAGLATLYDSYIKEAQAESWRRNYPTYKY